MSWFCSTEKLTWHNILALLCKSNDSVIIWYIYAHSCGLWQDGVALTLNNKMPFVLGIQRKQTGTGTFNWQTVFLIALSSNIS